MEEAALVGLQEPTNQFDQRQVAYALAVPLTQPNYCDRHNRHQSQARYQMIPGNREVTILVLVSVVPVAVIVLHQRQY